MGASGYRDDADYDKVSCFAKLPLAQYKYVLTKDVGRSMYFRVMPSFISIRQGSDFGSVVFPSTILSYYANKEYVIRGFEFRTDYCNGKTVIYEKGFARHTPYGFAEHNRPYIWVKEVTGNGEVMYAFDYETIGSIFVFDNNFEMMYKTPRRAFRADLLEIPFEKKFYNYSGAISWYLPDMGGYIK